DLRMSSKLFCAAILFAAIFIFGQAARAESKIPDEAEAAFAAGDYSKAIEILNREAAASPRDAGVQHLLARCYFESEQFDRAIPAAEAAISLDAKNSVYHELLGRAYGEKADRSGWFSALSLAKKARKEFETAVELDERNFSAMQALIEFDCSAPGIVGGGEDKAAKEIEKIAALDAAEGHYAHGNCRRQKKDYATADAEFTKALESNPMSVDLVYDIGDYAMKRDQAERLAGVVEAGEKLSPTDPRGAFYEAVAAILKGEQLSGAENTIRHYIDKVPRRNVYPSPAMG